MSGDFCAACGSHAVSERVAAVKHVVGRREVVIDNDRHLHCSACGNVSYRGVMLDENQQAIAAKIRTEDGLLTLDELKAVRLKYGFTQAEMEKLLTIGPKTWGRWERGKVVQSNAADEMIRQLAKNPDVLRDLMKAHGVRSDTAEQMLNAIDQTLERKLAERLRQRLPTLSAEVLADVARQAVAEMRSVHQENDRQACA